MISILDALQYQTVILNQPSNKISTAGVFVKLTNVTPILYKVVAKNMTFTFKLDDIQRIVTYKEGSTIVCK